MSATERGATRATVLVAVGVVAAVVVAAAAVIVATRGGGDGDEDQRAAQAAVARFTAAVEKGTPGAGGTVQPAAEVDAELAATVEGLGEWAIEVDDGDVVLAPEDGPTATATVALRSRWTVSGADWESTGTLTLERAAGDGTDGPWKARWDLASLDDRLAPGDLLTVEATDPERAALLDGAGEPLVAPTPVVVVGVVPQRVTDVDGLSLTLAQVLDVDGPALAARIRAAQPDAFVDVITLRRPDYEDVKAQIYDLPGTDFREETRLLAPSRTFARAVLGAVGPATAEQVEAAEGRLQAGDLTGQGGLQAAYDEQLQGSPGLEVRVTSEGAEPRVLTRVEAEAGQAVRTTLDVATQTAAEAALAGETRVSALVALRVSTSEVIAVANGPSATTNNVAFTARVPPGSTFKVVTTHALLGTGLTADEQVPCPPTASVDGRSFKNAGDGSIAGNPPFRSDFAESCNTAFVGLSERLAADSLPAAGAAFGLGGDWKVGLNAFTGSVPATESAVDAAAASIGQGRLETSPLSMAGVAATVAAGRWKAPTLVVDPPVAGAPAELPLDPGVAETLRALMRGVVTDGTGSALADVPGGEVHAKTGTAEYGNDDPPKAHAWVIGFQGDVAFAVFVEGGESGSRVAAPIAARFLTELQGG